MTFTAIRPVAGRAKARERVPYRVVQAASSMRDSSTMNPGQVDVVVYPPISVEDWTIDDLSDRIAEVRQLYLDTLKDWPEDKVPTPDIYRRRPAKQSVPAKKAPAKKAATKKAPAKKAAVKKVAAKKQPARKAAVKKAQPVNPKAQS